MDQESWNRLFDFSGRVAIVTGGTRGIGRSIAEGFVAAGAKVVVASRKEEACRETERHLVARGGEAFGVPTHMGDLDSVAALARSAAERFGRIDIIVNNAATALTQPLGHFPLLFVVVAFVTLHKGLRIGLDTNLFAAQHRGDGGQAVEP